MANLSDAIKKSFLNNLGKEGIKRAYDNVTSPSEEEDDKKRKLRMAALQKHIDNYKVSR